MKVTTAGLVLVLLVSCSDDGGDGGDAATVDAAVGDQTVAGDHAPADSPQSTHDSSLPPDLQSWCVGTTAKLRIGTEDQTGWTEMDAPGSLTGKEMTIEPQFKLGGVKHSFFLTVLYAKTVISPLTVDLAALQSGESVTKNGPTGAVVPPEKRKGIVEIVAAGGGFKLNVCAWIDGESFFIPGMPMS